jgi:release factor H-coupled RctB family protein
MNTITETHLHLIATARNWVEAEALRQLCAAAKLEGVALAAGLPNLQPGGRSPAGAAFATNAVIHPHLVGADIGCGLGLWATTLRRDDATPDRWAEARFDLEQPWEGDVDERLMTERLRPTPFDESLGTLGDGDHFAELQAVESVQDDAGFERLGLSAGQLVLLVHAGSGGLGRAVLRAFEEDHGTLGVDAGSPAATRYLTGHSLATRWARAGRALIADRFLAALNATGRCVLDASHNSLTRHEHGGEALWLHRRGAVPADAGPLVIAGSRGAFSYLVQPRGDGAAGAWSLPHAAGRKLSRSESRARVRARFKPEQLLQTGLGSRVICGDRRLLYEDAPPAYKNIEVVIADLVEAGLASVIATLRPVLTYKARA